MGNHVACTVAPGVIITLADAGAHPPPPSPVPRPTTIQEERESPCESGPPAHRPGPLPATRAMGGNNHLPPILPPNFLLNPSTPPADKYGEEGAFT